MGSSSDKTKLGIAGAALGTLTLASLVSSPGTDNNIVNQTNYSTVQEVDENEFQSVDADNGRVQVDVTVTEGSGTYTGDIIDGMKHDSSGKFEFTNGYVYEGSFIHNKIDGAGKLTIPGVGVYQGIFSDGKRSGKGVMTYSNGDIYNGDWDNDQMSGTGTYTFANGDKYTGEFSANKYNGTGTYTFSSNSKSYTGTWTNNNYKN